MQKMLNDFLSYLLEGQAKKNTLDAYRRDLTDYVAYLHSLNIHSFLDVKRSHVLEYQASLIDSELATTSIARKVSSVRSLYRFLCEKGVANDNPAADIKPPKPIKPAIEILSRTEVEQLLAQPDIQTPKGVRDRAMLEVLYATGMRVSEVCGLSVKDVNLKNSYIFCHNGGKERVIPVYPIAVECLKDYIENARPKFAKDQNKCNTLFLNNSGEALSRQGFWKILKRYALDAGIAANITPHTMRHSFATHLLENGADIHDLRDIMGHADISSMHVYKRYLKNKLRSSYIKHHPRA